MKVSFSLISLGLAAHLMALTNEEVSIKSYHSTSEYISENAQMEMVLKNATGETNKRNLSMKKLEGNNGDKTLMEFSSPADVKGTMLLTHEHLDQDDNQWLYMPGLKKTKRIISKNKSGSFMGSEFSYEDLSSQHYKKFTYSENAKEIMIAGVKQYQAMRTPKDENSGYSKQMLWVESKNFLIQKIEYYDKNGALLKVALFPDYKKIDGVWRGMKIIMKNVQTNKETTLDWTNEKIKVGYNPKDFAQSILQN
jgi:hypothetical protein